MSRRALTRLLPLSLAVLSVTSACAPKRAERSAPDGDATSSGVALDARLLQMVDRRVQDTSVVDAVLRDASAPRRARGALAVGQVKLRARYAVLRRLLADPDTGVAANAAYALGLVKDTTGVVPLARAVAGAPAVVAREAAWALGEVGEPSRVTLAVALGEGVAQPRRQSTAAQRAPAVRAALVMATIKLRPVPVAIVTPWLADTSAEVVRAAAYVLGRPRSPGGVRALLSVKAHPDEETRQHVARGLARSATGDSLAAAAREALRGLLADASPRVRMNAARSIASFGPSALRDVELALADADANVRVAAAEGVQAVFASDGAAWRRAWDRDTTFRVRQQLMLAARGAGVSTLAAGEDAWAASKDWRYRAASLEARSADDRTDRLALARTFAADGDVRVRAAAIAAVPATANDADARALVTPALADGDVQVRAAALRVLTRRARSADMDAALAAFSRAENETDGDARVAALRLIAAVWARDSAKVDQRTRQRLADMNGRAAAGERQVVAAVTPMAAWARARVPEPVRPLADYERLVRRWGVPGARQPTAVIRTARGDITLELDGANAPLVVEAFIRLAGNGYYRNSYFHRVVPNFVVQDGDSRGDGNGNPGFTLRESYSRRRHERGALGLATSGPDTGGSQYYLCHSSQPHLDGAYTVFGHITEGFEVLDRIVQGDRMIRVEIR